MRLRMAIGWGNLLCTRKMHSVFLYPCFGQHKRDCVRLVELKRPLEMRSIKNQYLSLASALPTTLETESEIWFFFSANSLKLKITSGFKSNRKSNEIWTFYGSTFPLSSHLKPSLIFFDKQNHFSILYSPWLRRGYNVLSTFAAESIHQCSRSNICFPSPQMIFFRFISFWWF